MKASDLANKLESPGFKLVTPEEEALTCKCVRLAADMEKLTSISTVRFMVSRTDEIICSCASWNDTFEMRAVGPDIYTAARKAVEELEGKR